MSKKGVLTKFGDTDSYGDGAVQQVALANLLIVALMSMAVIIGFTSVVELRPAQTNWVEMRVGNGFISVAEFRPDMKRLHLFTTGLSGVGGSVLHPGGAAARRYGPAIDRTVVRNRGEKLTDEEFDEEIRLADVGGDAQAEVCGGVEGDAYEGEVGQFMEVFKVVDRNGDGSTSAEELRHDAKHSGEEFADGEVADMIREVDRDPDGQINYEDFADRRRWVSRCELCLFECEHSPLV